MEFNYNSFNIMEAPIITLCKPNTDEVGIVNNISELTLAINFNQLSEISFKITKPLSDKNSSTIFDLVKTRKQLFVENCGYFIIKSADTSTEETGETKVINGVSCETEISNAETPYISGTYKLYNEDNPNDVGVELENRTILGMIMAKIPTWGIKYIDPITAKKYRTFDVPVSDLYSFMINDLEESFECLFEFDIINRKISVFDRVSYIAREENSTSIVISCEDVIETIKISESAEEHATVLNVSGGNNLVISNINPLGGNLIYNFTYYKTEEWLSKSTVDAITKWEDKCREYEGSGGAYFLKRQLCDSKMNELSAENNTLYVYETDLKNLELQKSDAIVVGEQLSSINGQIQMKIVQINSQKQVVSNLQKEITALQKEISSITSDLSIQNTSNFTAQQQQEIACLIKVSNFKDETISRTDNIDYATEQERSFELYDKAITAFKQIYEPKYVYSVDVGDVIFSKYFQHISEQLKAGCLIDVVLNNDTANPELVTLILLDFKLDFEENSCTFTFGNKYKNKDALSLYNDFVSNFVKASNTIEWNREMWQNTSAEVPSLVSFTKDSLNLAKNAVLSADGQSIQIDENGYWGRKILADNESISPEQLRIINNTIAFSDDGFDSAKTAIGKIMLPEGVLIDGKDYVYGINAEYISGDIIVGNGLTIKTKGGTSLITGEDVIDETLLQVDGTSITNYVAKTTYTKDEVEERLEAEITQTSEEWLARFGKTGGDNLVTNSSGVYGLFGWDCSSGVEVINTINTSATKAFYLQSGTMSLEENISVIAGTRYAIYFKYKTILVDKGVVELNIGGETISLSASEDWSEYQNNFVVAQDLLNINISCSNANLTISDLIIIEGSYVNTWRQAPNETKNGMVSIYGGGIVVDDSTSDFKGEYTNDKVQYTNKTTGETVAQFDVNGAEMGKTIVKDELTIVRKSNQNNAFRAIPVSDGIMFVIND